jgi:DNA polymerase-3 subunit beta
VKIRIDRAAFAAATRHVARQIPSKPTAPILAGLLLDADGDALTVSSYDQETCTRHVLAADTLTPGRIVVSGRLLADIAGTLDGDSVELAVDGEQATVTCGSSRFELALMPVRDYPTLPEQPAASGTIAGDLFAAAVTQAITATDPNASAAIAALAGIRLTPGSDTLTVAATDRYRFAQHVIPWQTDSIDMAEVVVPARALVEAAKAGAEGDVRLALPQGGTNVGLESAARSTVMRLIDGPFPPIERVFPTEFEAVAELDAAELAAAARRVAMVAEDKTPLFCEFTDGQLTIQASTGSVARGADRIEASLDGVDRMRIAFKAAYLLDGLTPLDGAIRLHLVNATTPVLIDSETKASYRYLIMPVRHDWTQQ